MLRHIIHVYENIHVILLTLKYDILSSKTKHCFKPLVTYSHLALIVKATSLHRSLLSNIEGLKRRLQFLRPCIFTVINTKVYTCIIQANAILAGCLQCQQKRGLFFIINDLISLNRSSLEPSCISST